MTPSERLLKDREHPRFNMVNCQLRPNGISDARLIQAFESVPMEAFVPPAIQSFVYADADLPLTQSLPLKRWLLAPLTLAKLLQLAAIQPADKVLVVGCGSGYSVALIAQLASRVIGIESHEDLAMIARTYGTVQEITNIQVITGALSSGYLKEAPYNVIVIEGAVVKISSGLIQQLCPHNGRLVTVIKEKNKFGQGVLVTRINNIVNQVVRFDASCPYLPEFEPVAGFEL